MSEDIEKMANIIRQLYKIDSKLRACPVLAAYRENRRLIAELEKTLVAIKNESDNNPQNNMDR